MDRVEGAPRLRIESDDAVKEGTEPNPLSHEVGNEQADLGDDFEQREPSATPAAGVQSEEADFLQQSEDGERDFKREDENQEEKNKLLQDGEWIQLHISEDANEQKMNAETGEASDMLTVPENGALKGKEEEAGIAQGITTNDQDGNDHLKQRKSSVAAGDGAQNESGDEPQNFHSARDVGDETSQNATLQYQLDPVEDATEEVGDLHGHEKKTVGVTTLEPESEDEGVNEEGNTSKGLGKPSAVGVISNDQSNNLEKDSADKIAPTLEEAGAGLKAGQSTGNETGFQPAGVDWILGFPNTVNKSVDKKLPGDQQSTRDQEDSELIPGLSQADGTNGTTQTLVSQHQADQPNQLAVRLSSAETNWDGWEDVIKTGPTLFRGTTLKKAEDILYSREYQTLQVNSLEGGDGSKTDLLGVSEHQNGSESPSHADSETGSSKPARLVEGLKSSPVVNNLSAAMNSGEEVGGVNQEADGSPKSREFLDSGLGRAKGVKEGYSKEDTSRLESCPAGVDKLSSAQEDCDDWEDVKESPYVPAGSRQSPPSFEDAHDGELSSEHEYPDGRTTEVDLSKGKRHWAEWEDLTKSEYMLLDGPRGQKLTFKRISDPSGSRSGKPLGRKISLSFEEPDDDGSASLNRNGRLQPFEDERSPSFRTLKSSSPTGVVKSDHSAGSNSFPGVETSRTSLPGSSSRKSDVVGMADKEPLVSKRPLIYRGSRTGYTSEIEEMEEVTSDPQHQHLQHYHNHNHLEQEEALKYDVEKILKGQTTYDLICPICGAMITRKIILRKKSRFLREGDPMSRRTPDISPVADDDANQSPRSDTSSQSEDATGNWKKGIRPCLGYFFGD